MNETLVGEHRHKRAKGTAMRRHKRSIYVVDGDLQLRFVRQFAALALIAILLCAANLYVVLELVPYYPVSPEGASVSLIDQSFYWFYGGATLVISLAIFFSVALYISHRFAGPEVKIVKGLRRLANRDTAINVTLREGDFLRDVAVAVNSAAAAWQDSAKDVTSAVALLRRRPEVAKSAEMQAIVRAIEAAVGPELPPNSSSDS